MKVPIVLKIGGLTVVATAFYTYVGQLVPQKEVQPPAVTELSADMTTEDLVEIGKGVVEGKGLCMTCHTIGRSGALRFPDLEGIATRAADRVAGLSSLEYLSQSLYDPEAYIVPGFTPGMPVANRPPISLTDEEIRAVLAYLQTLGGTPDITMETVIPYSEAAAGATQVAAADEAAAGEEARDAAAGGGAPAAAAGGGGGALVAQLGCTPCHGQQAAPLDPGTRSDRDGVVTALAAHEQIAGAESAARAVTLSQARALAAYLVEGGG